jgi:NhaP-type Na+/H+ or K+/H+ antiporter
VLTVPPPVPTLALACFAAAQSLHGSGYIAAFVGGLIFGRVTVDFRKIGVS